MTTTVEAFAAFDFGLSPAEEERAARLHSEAIVVDLCFSGPISYRSFGSELESDLREAWLRDRDPLRLTFAALGRSAELARRGTFPDYENAWQASGVTVGTRPVELATLELALTSFGIVHAQCAELPWLIEARTVDDIRRAKAAGLCASLSATQLIAGPGQHLLELLEPAHALGLRLLQLTYNSMTVVGAGCMEPGDQGLSTYGARVVSCLNELGIVVDTAHCGRQTTLDACEVSERPVVSSHSSAKGVYQHVRGKTDEELEAIAGTGGVIGIVAVPFFLSPSPTATVESMLDHVDYFVRLVGPEHVAIGTDWPFPLPKALLEECVGALAAGSGFGAGDIPSPTQNLIGFDDYRDFPNITRGLVKRGYDDAEIRGMLGENALRVFDVVWA